MSELDSIAPLGCPFCGRPMETQESATVWWHRSMVECIMAGRMVDKNFEAIAAWNRRSASEGTEQAVARGPEEEAAYFASIWRLSNSQMQTLEQAFRNRDKPGLTSSVSVAHQGQFTAPLADREKSAASPILAGRDEVIEEMAKVAENGLGEGTFGTGRGLMFLTGYMEGRRAAAADVRSLKGPTK